MHRVYNQVESARTRGQGATERERLMSGLLRMSDIAMAGANSTDLVRVVTRGDSSVYQIIKYSE